MHVCVLRVRAESWCAKLLDISGQLADGCDLVGRVLQGDGGHMDCMCERVWATL